MFLQQFVLVLQAQSSLLTLVLAATALLLKVSRVNQTKLVLHALTQFRHFVQLRNAVSHLLLKLEIIFNLLFLAGSRNRMRKVS